MMKKYIIGALIGFVLSLGASAHAEVVSMIGKVIDGSFPIKINGATLQNPALTIDGVSYVPTREFAESLGAKVKFNADLGIEVVPSSIPAPDATKEQRKKEIHEEITKNALEIQTLKAKIGKAETYREQDGIPLTDNNVELYKQQVTEKEARIQELVKERDALLTQP